MIKIPTYVFSCKCGEQQEVIRPMKAAQLPYKCPNCGKYMVRNYAAERPHIGDKEYARPIVSDSLAIMPSQRAEHEKRFPDIKLDSECRPIFDNFKSHDNYLKETGFRKVRQRIKRRGKKLT